MPKVVLYVPAALHREIEGLASANGYEKADDMIRALSLATLDELVTGVAMQRDVRVYNPTASDTSRPAPKTVSSVDETKTDFKGKVKLPGISSAEAAVAAQRLASDGKCWAYAPAGTKCKYCGKVHA